MNTPMYNSCSIYRLIFIILFLSFYKSGLPDIPVAKSSHSKLTSLTNDTSAKLNIIMIVGDDIGFEIPVVDGGQLYSTPPRRQNNTRSPAVKKQSAGRYQ